MSKPENSFIAGVHKHLPAALYRMKLHNAYIGGPADMWYSGRERDLWVEYKYESLPKRASTLVPIDLSELQKEWLSGRQSEGRNVFVIVGCEKGGVVFANPRDWLTPLTLTNFLGRIQSRKDLASWIFQQTGGPP